MTCFIFLPESYKLTAIYFAPAVEDTPYKRHQLELSLVSVVKAFKLFVVPYNQYDIESQWLVYYSYRYTVVYYRTSATPWVEWSIQQKWGVSMVDFHRSRKTRDESFMWTTWTQLELTI